MKFVLSICIILLLPFYGYSQKTSRDLLVLKNGNTQSGKIIYSDSVSLTLKKYDRSTQHYKWAELDSVKGLSYKTCFFSGGLGFTHVNYWSTLLYENVKSNSICYQYKFGVLKYGHWSKYAHLDFNHSSPFKIQRLGVGGSYYFNKDYIQKMNWYGGVDANLTIVEHNKNFVSVGLHVGSEYLYKNRYRLFAELDLQRAIFNINQNSSFSILVGIRSGKEFGKYYKKLNTTHRLP